MLERTWKFLLTIVLIFGVTVASSAQELPKRIFHAYRNNEAPIINGILDDPAWQEYEWEGGFTQHEPYEGRDPSQATAFKICFDDLHMYVAIKAYDSSPDSITNRMSRRDNGDGDMVFLVLDSYHDLRTGFVYGVSSAGVRFDMIMANNGQSEDVTWDPIWQAKAETHAWGWAAEMKIPFTQLRFQKNSGELWGLEVGRQIFRHNEMSFWQHIPRNAPGFVHAIGELAGLDAIEPRKQFDVTPYAVGAYHSYEGENGNPFADGRDPQGNIGFDAKIGLTNNLTLDLTVFPDFGQIEADPSEVNLSAFESFFEEKRPFFIEGNNITSFNVGLGDGDIGNDNLFYSRRIGRRPHGDPDIGTGEYSLLPSFTDILGAAKLTGKTEGGLSIGILESLTKEVKAKISDHGTRSTQVIEPLTNYALARLQKDFNGGNTIIGGALTSTIRRLDGVGLDWLHKNATTAGFDFVQLFNERNYRLTASLYASNVQGSAEAIAHTQCASARYFNRPDADYVNYDSTRTSLSGHGGKLEFGKIGGNWNFMFLNTWKSPGIELNDMGYMQRADQISNVLWSAYNWTEPFGIFRSLRVGANLYSSFDFGGTFTGNGFQGNFYTNFKNFWSAGAGGGFNANNVSNGMLRGGPSMLIPNSWRLFYWFNSDRRKKISMALSGRLNRGAEDQVNINSFRASLTLRPSNTLSVILSPKYSTTKTELQYLTSMDLNGEERYIFGTLDQKIISMSLRVNFNITPDLTIQYWGQPFSGDINFRDYKIIMDPRAKVYADRFRVFTPSEISVTEDVNTVTNSEYTFDFDNPDFKTNEWLSNLVVRWEFHPGSTIYLVWSQTRDYEDGPGAYSLRDNLNYLFTNKKANNTFLAKFSYRLGLR